MTSLCIYCSGWRPSKLIIMNDLQDDTIFYISVFSTTQPGLKLNFFEWDHQRYSSGKGVEVGPRFGWHCVFWWVVDIIILFSKKFMNHELVFIFEFVGNALDILQTCYNQYLLSVVRRSSFTPRKIAMCYTGEEVGMTASMFIF